MSEDRSESEPRRETARQQAAQAIERLDGLMLDVYASRESENKALTPASEKALALIADSISLAEGLSNGAIVVGQPRMATNLVQVVAELDEIGQHSLAAEFTRVLRWISVNGLAAENCSLGRNRISPNKQ